MYINCEGLGYYPSSEIQEKICNFYAVRGILLIPEEIFPKELRGLSKNRPKKYIFTQEIPREFLIATDKVDRKLLTTTNTEEEIDKKDLEKILGCALGTLTKREEDVVRLYFGIGYEQEKTLEQIGEIYEVCKEDIRIIKEKALKKLKYRARNLKEFW